MSSRPHDELPALARGFVTTLKVMTLSATILWALIRLTDWLGISKYL